MDNSANAIRATLESLAEPDYARFASGLLPGVDNLLGVRLPKLRRLARQLARGDWRAYLDGAGEDTFEEVLLQGLVIGCLQAPPETVLPLVAAFVPKIGNWSVCDSFCSSLKLAARYPDEVWAFIQPYLADPREFHVRFGVVMLLFYYLEGSRAGEAVALLDGVRHEGYYARMAVAWALSIAAVRRPDVALPYLEHGGHPDPFVRRKTLQKILESRQLPAEERERFRAMLRGLQHGAGAAGAGADIPG